jgi:hypothetical protein
MAVPARAIAERRIAEHFMASNAVRSDSAIDYEPTRFVRERAFERLKDKGIIQGAPGGRWYLDVPAWTERHSGRRKRIVGLMLGGVIVGALAAIL